MGYWRNLVRAAFAPWLRSAAGYEAASTGRRLTSWRATEEGINALVFGSGAVLRSRSRDMVRKNAWAANAIDSFVANAVGSGIKPQSRHPDPSVRAQLHKLWLRWTDEADAGGLTDFYGLQALVCRAVIEGGECLVRLRDRRAEDGLSVPLQLQVLEAEHLPADKSEDLGQGRSIRAGIEFDPIGRRTAYHLYREHPGEKSIFANALELVRVPASAVLHIYRPLRPGQLRGAPWLAPVLVKLYELDQYDDAELVRKKVAAMFAGFITKSADDSPLPGTTTLNDGATTAPEKTDFVGLEPGILQELLPGEDVKFSEPADVGGLYSEFMRVQLRAIAAGLGITYEQLTGDLTGVNYSSIRAGLLEFRRRCEQFQFQVMVYQFCRPVWRRWVEAAVLAGALRAPGYARDPEPYRDVEWRTPRWAWVDPLKDTRAEIEQIQAGLKSRSAAVHELGYDPEQVDQEIADDNARADALGNIYTSDGRRQAKNAATPISTDEDATQGRQLVQ